MVSANGEVISKANKRWQGPNDLCKDAQTKPEDKTENSRSVGFVLTYGKFKFLDLGDLTWDREMMLACPVNKLGDGYAVPGVASRVLGRPVRLARDGVGYQAAGRNRE